MKKICVIIDGHPAEENADRRDFLKYVAVAGSFSLVGAAQPRAAEAALPRAIGPFTFRELAAQFVDKTVPNSESLQDEIRSADVADNQPAWRDFHSWQGSPYAIEGIATPAIETRYGFWILVRKFPYGDDRQAVRGIKDLTGEELRRVINPSEIDDFGSVVHPCGPRSRPTVDDKVAFDGVCRECYGAKPSSFRLDYVRPFANPTSGKSHRGFGLTSRHRPTQKDVFIDSEPIA